MCRFCYVEDDYNEVGMGVVVFSIALGLIIGVTLICLSG